MQWLYNDLTFSSKRVSFYPIYLSNTWRYTIKNGTVRKERKNETGNKLLDVKKSFQTFD